MDVPFLRTPDSEFQNVPDFPYHPHYVNNGKLRMAYIDERFDNSKNDIPQETFLCLHGQPTWSYLYRKMIPILLTHTTKNEPISRRVIAPDLFGFGRSDKPTEDSVYTYNFHRNALLYFIRHLNLQHITLVVQDWGGILGLTLPHEEPWRFKRLIVMNTALPVGSSAGKGFTAWRDFNNRNPDMDITGLMRRSTPHLSTAEAQAYSAPYPDLRYKGGVRRFPNLVMTDSNMEGVDVSKKAIGFYQSTDQFKTGDIFMACGMKDPVLGPPAMEVLSKVWKNGCYWAEVPNGGHFVQEWGDKVALLAIQKFENPGVEIEGVKQISPIQPRL